MVVIMFVIIIIRINKIIRMIYNIGLLLFVLEEVLVIEERSVVVGLRCDKINIE